MASTNNSYTAFFHKVKTFYPEIAEECKPILPKMGKSEIKTVFEAFREIQCNTPEDLKKNDKTVLLVAVLVMFFDPDYFIVKRPLRFGLRSLIAELMNLEPTGISHKLTSVEFYYRLNDQFRDEVIRTCEKISEKTGIVLEV